MKRASHLLAIAGLGLALGCHRVKHCVADECACTDHDDCVMDPCYYRSGSPDSCVNVTDCDNGYPVNRGFRDYVQANYDVQCENSSCTMENTQCETSTTFEARCSMGECIGVEVTAEGR